jgi:hypothetical protein
MTDTTVTQTTQNSHLPTKASALSKFDLKFEYDQSWDKAKTSVQHRPSKK